MLPEMKTQEELRADFQRFMDADMLDEAEAVLGQLEPLSDEEWQRFLSEAPLDDEPVTSAQRARLDEAHRIAEEFARRQAG